MSEIGVTLIKREPFSVFVISGGRGGTSHIDMGDLGQRLSGPVGRDFPETEQFMSTLLSNDFCRLLEFGHALKGLLD
jgi:hypothetical protein